jgi:hypothetical protein
MMRLAGHVAWTEEKNSYNLLVGNLKERYRFGKSRSVWERITYDCSSPKLQFSPCCRLRSRFLWRYILFYVISGKSVYWGQYQQ